MVAETMRFGGPSWLSALSDHGMNNLDEAYLAVAAVLAVLWLICLQVTGAYDKRFLGSGPEEYGAVVRGTGTAFSVLAIVSWALKLEIARGFVLIALPLGIVMLLAGHWALRHYLVTRRAHGELVQEALVVGGGEDLRSLVRCLQDDQAAGYHVMAICTDDPVDEIEGVPVVGSERAAGTLAAETNVDVVVCAATNSFACDDVRRLGWELERNGAELMLAPRLTDVAGPRITTRLVSGLSLLLVERPHFSGPQLLLKTVMDKTIAAVGLLVLAPLFAVVALLVRLPDGGKAIFRQVRVGINGEEFTMYKFRSMCVDAEQRRAAVVASGEGADIDRGPAFKAKSDSRITKVGRILRKTSIDELPQLFNVLRGDMSLVGPRPPLPSEVAKYDPREGRRLLVRPGLTGLWQINGRSDLPWDEAIRFDLYYVENWSVMRDLMIMFRTVRAVLLQRGAY